MLIMSPVSKFQTCDNSKAKIKNIFKIKGAADVALKLPYEFRIPPKRDERDTIKI